MIFFDHNSTTSLHPEVGKLMHQLGGQYLNPSSIHSYGRFARNLLEQARLKVAQAVNAHSGYKVIFTASGTEANNLIIHNYASHGIVLISAVEHASIFEQQKFYPTIKVMKVDSNGVIDIQHLTQTLHSLRSPNIGQCIPKILISVMLANNESGAIQPIKEITKLAALYKAAVHTDAVQALGKIKVDMSDLGVDFLTISGHKIGGPVGIGALIMKDIHSLIPHLIGGGQERGIRGGTENVIAAQGLGLAIDVANQQLMNYYDKVVRLREYLEHRIKSTCREAIIFGQQVLRLPNTSLISMPNVEAERQLISFDLAGIAISAGSACSSGKISKSHVLRAMNVDESIITCTIRVSFNSNNTKEEIDFFVKKWQEIHG